MALTDYEKDIRTEELLALQKAPDALTCPRRTVSTVLAVVVSAALATTPGCAFAIEHPAVTAGAVAGTLGFATCKLASDSYGACALVGGGAAALLSLVAATALWLGGDGHSTAVEAQAQPLPEDSRPRRRQRRPPAEPDLPTSPSPTSPSSSPTSPSPTSPSPTSPSPSPASPSPTSPSPASPSPASPSPPATPAHP